MWPKRSVHHDQCICSIGCTRPFWKMLNGCSFFFNWGIKCSFIEGLQSFKVVMWSGPCSEFRYLFICLRMANISNWNKALWTPNIIYYNFSGDWNVLFRFRYLTIHGDIFIHILFNLLPSTPSFPKPFLPLSFSSTLTCSRVYSLRHSFRRKPQDSPLLAY